MQDTGYILLVLLSSLLMLTGCSRHELLDDYPVSGVDIKLDWSGIIDKLPEGIRVIFCPKSAEGRKIDTYLSVRGGKVKVPSGRYSVVVYNYDTETVQIKGEEAHETIEAFTGYCNGLGIAGTEKMAWGPDPLYVVQIDDLHITNSKEELLLDQRPKLVVKAYFFRIKMGGLGYVSSIVGSVEGMTGCYCLGRYCGMMCNAPIYFKAQGRSDEVTGSFTTFGMPEAAISRTGGKIKLALAFIKVDKTMRKAETDVTEVATNSESGGSGGGSVDESPTEIELPLNEKVKIEKPTTSPDGGGDGTGEDVGDWGNEDEVILPAE